MHRRDFLKTVAALPVTTALFGGKIRAAGDTAETWAQQAAEHRAEALAAFPYDVVEAGGDAALQEWDWLKTTKPGVPVVVGNDEDLAMIAETFHPDFLARAGRPSVAEILAKADRLTHPEGLLAHRAAESEQAARYCDDNPDICQAIEAGVYRPSVCGDHPERCQDFEIFVGEPGPCEDSPERCQAVEAFEVQPRADDFATGADDQPPLGASPQTAPGDVGLLVALDWRTGRPFERVNIVVVPTDDWTTIPAYLNLGGWNANPPPEYHVAALRSWRDRYGAELIGLSHDSLNIRVATHPGSRAEALALAREQYVYCNDIVDQGMGTLPNLAAALTSNDWWYFWWD